MHMGLYLVINDLEKKQVGWDTRLNNKRNKLRNKQNKVDKIENDDKTEYKSRINSGEQRRK